MPPLPLTSRLAEFRAKVSAHTRTCFGCEQPLGTDTERLYLVEGDEATGGTEICRSCYDRLIKWMRGWNRAPR